MQTYNYACQSANLVNSDNGETLEDTRDLTFDLHREPVKIHWPNATIICSQLVDRYLSNGCLQQLKTPLAVAYSAEPRPSQAAPKATSTITSSPRLPPSTHDARNSRKDALPWKLLLQYALPRRHPTGRHPTEKRKGS